jgi:hypothetical protein
MIKYFVSSGALISAMAALMGAAQAAPKCALGQIYRVTQKVCVDKTTAIRDGVIKTRQKAARKTVRRAPPKQRIAARTNISKAARPPLSNAAPITARAREAQIETPAAVEPRRIFVGRSSSPFGALFDPWAFGGGFNGSQETRFSLRLAPED